MDTCKINEGAEWSGSSFGFVEHEKRNIAEKI